MYYTIPLLHPYLLTSELKQTMANQSFHQMLPLTPIITNAKIILYYQYLQ